MKVTRGNLAIADSWKETLAHVVAHHDASVNHDDGFGFMDQLKRDARTVAVAHGHTLGHFRRREFNGSEIAHCPCGRFVIADGESGACYGKALTEPCTKETP